MAVMPVVPFNAIPLLAGIRAADRTSLEPLCHMRRYEKGEAIFHESDPAERMHFVVAGRVGVARGKETFIPLALSRQELADLLGTTLETTIRLMSRWQKDQLILTERDGFAIPDVQALRDLEP